MRDRNKTPTLLLSQHTTTSNSNTKLIGLTFLTSLYDKELEKQTISANIREIGSESEVRPMNLYKLSSRNDFVFS